LIGFEYWAAVLMEISERAKRLSILRKG
jgi:hypothetical protein